MRMVHRLAVFAVVGLIGLPLLHGEEPAPHFEPDQTWKDLQAYLKEIAPTFELPESEDAWANHADALRQRVLDEVVFQGVPERWRTGGVRVEWQDTINADGYTIRKLRYEPVPGLWVGALLYVPDDFEGRVPGVLNVNGHVGAPGMTVDYKQARCINLAKRGVIALNTEWIGMGQLSGNDYNHNNSAHLDLCGVSSLSVFYLSMSRALDILLDHEGVDPERIAVTGLSGGGWQTIIISALDTRVKLAAPNAGYIGIAERIDHRGDIGDLEQNPTDLVSMADYVHLTALLAPRPALLIYNEKDECCFPAERAKRSVYDPIVPLYQLLDAEDRFAFHVNSDPGTHNYELDNRQAFYRFLNKHFLSEDQHVDEEINVVDEILSQEKLTIEYPEANANFFSLAESVADKLPTHPASEKSEPLIAAWRVTTRRQLSDVIRIEPPTPMLIEEVPVKLAAPPGVIFPAYYRLKTEDGRWTLPATGHSLMERKGVTLVVADGGEAEVKEIIRSQAEKGQYVIVADVLFTGLCRTAHVGQHAMLLSTLGKRPLGIQVRQFQQLVQWAQSLGTPDGPFHVVVKGRTASLAALICAALHPELMNTLEIHDLEKSFKTLIEKHVGYGAAPSIFCFGLLKVADIPDLAALAKPTEITWMESESAR